MVAFSAMTPLSTQQRSVATEGRTLKHKILRMEKMHAFIMSMSSPLHF